MMAHTAMKAMNQQTIMIMANIFNTSFGKVSCFEYIIFQLPIKSYINQEAYYKINGQNQK